MASTAKLVIGSVVGIASLSLVVFAMTNASRRNADLEFFRAQTAKPSGFDTADIFEGKFAEYTFVSDHEIAATMSKVQVTANGIEIGGTIEGITVSSHSQKPNGEIECKLLSGNFTQFNLATKTSSHHRQDEKEPFELLAADQYAYPGEEKNILYGECGPIIMSLKGDMKTLGRPKETSLGCLYWPAVKGFIDRSPATGSSIAIRDHKDRALDNTIPIERLADGRWLHSRLGIDSENRLLLTWTTSDYKTGFCRGRFDGDKVAIEDVREAPMNNNEPFAVSLDGKYVVYTRRMDSKGLRSLQEIVCQNLETEKEEVMGTYETSRIRSMMISPKNSYLLLALPNSLVWKKMPKL